uniref:Uncharacterized protein n=1 Tax=Candidatus Kentrum sp. UNK TaxID=2126344 RepID=A0A451AF54_9GAMM|nr:MAG: hypothetical protein BECKUNK1418G_GA0071005_104921 [Candidatus Kentron sp. UNK]VFK71177.1 MAG: hypothetical protein BECKUNK1418H_GA0071006_105321 [Candidatus Kentron sp. UNK]
MKAIDELSAYRQRRDETDNHDNQEDLPGTGLFVPGDRHANGTLMGVENHDR